MKKPKITGGCSLNEPIVNGYNQALSLSQYIILLLQTLVESVDFDYDYCK